MGYQTSASFTKIRPDSHDFDIIEGENLVHSEQHSMASRSRGARRLPRPARQLATAHSGTDRMWGMRLPAGRATPGRPSRQHGGYWRAFAARERRRGSSI